MTYPNKRCQHGWLDAKDCETCKLLAEVKELRAAYIERAKEPIRDWVGLTGAEMYDLSEVVYVGNQFLMFGQAIEAALKAKNTPEETA